MNAHDTKTTVHYFQKFPCAPSLVFCFFLVRKLIMKSSLLAHFEVHNTILLIIGTVLYNRASAVTLVWTIFHITNIASVFRWIKISICIQPLNKCLLSFILPYFLRLSYCRHKMINAHYKIYNYPCKPRRPLLNALFNLVVSEIRIVRYSSRVFRSRTYILTVHITA